MSCTPHDRLRKPKENEQPFYKHYKQSLSLNATNKASPEQ